MKVSHKIAVYGMALSGLLSISAPSQACSQNESMIGTMCMFAGNFAPRNFAFANGQLLSIAQNQALFSILGTTYGGDGRTTFSLPDLRGRSPIGVGRGPGLNDIRLGERGGNELTTLNIQNMPAHNHNVQVTVATEADFSASEFTLRALSGRANSNNPTGAVLANSPNRENIYNNGMPSVDMSAESINANISANITNSATVIETTVGNNASFSNRSPYLGVHFIIAMQGTFPSRS